MPVGDYQNEWPYLARGIERIAPPEQMAPPSTSDYISVVNLNVNAGAVFNGNIRLVQGSIFLPPGNSLLPSIALLDDTDTGLWGDGAAIGFSGGGVQGGSLHAGGIRVVDGSALTPSLAFYDNTDMGFYRSGTALHWTVDNDSGGYLWNGGVRVDDGTVLIPSLAFSNNTDMGFYRSGTELRWTVDNNTGGYLWNGGIRVDDGAVSTPSYSFSSATNTGMYLSSTDLTLVRAGVNKVSIQTSVIKFVDQIEQQGSDEIGFVLQQTTVDATPNKYIQFQRDTGAQFAQVGLVNGNLRLYASVGEVEVRSLDDDIYLAPNNVIRWRATTAGTWRPETDDALDIGVSSTHVVRRIFTHVGDSNTGVPLEVDLTTGRLQQDTSSIRFKSHVTDWKPVDSWVEGLSKLRPSRWLKLPSDEGRMPHDPPEEPTVSVGLIAEDAVEGLGDEVAHIYKSEIHNYRDRAILAAVVGAIGELDDRLTGAGI